ncbi:hypothetical protein P3T35_003906 [Kitasatospora sp. GP30]|uniref:hypothetical protein n=1 Tax=Kitasatospora sp. GP30 TaxID=3035084 RepID=UPI000C70DF64|nr:hypothetical protein [Kitasatospora sp. GP30]MDH6141885.1 hypothetical protein [Kitasatospora sp. GP30]
MVSRDSGTAAGLRYTAVGIAATGLGGIGTAFCVDQAVLDAGLVGDQATFRIQKCITSKDGKTFTTSCWGTVHAQQGDWSARLDEMPSSYSPDQAVQVRCVARDCRQQDASGAAGFLMGFCVTLVVLGAGLLSLLTAARCWLGPDFARVTHPRRAKLVDKGFTVFWLSVVVLFFGSAVILLAGAH